MTKLYKLGMFTNITITMKILMQLTCKMFFFQDTDSIYHYESKQLSNFIQSSTLPSIYCKKNKNIHTLNIFPCLAGISTALSGFENTTTLLVNKHTDTSPKREEEEEKEVAQQTIRSSPPSLISANGTSNHTEAKQMEATHQI